MPKERGPFAKGVARRQRILEIALQEFAKNGYHGVSLAEIARKVGVSETSLFHYFESKQGLLRDLLAARDEASNAAEGGGLERDPLGGLQRTVRHNLDAPGLVRLYATTSADATDPEHKAHAFFVDRYRRFRRLLADQLAERQREGTLRADTDPEHLAAVLLAAADGLQVQWLLDPDVNMADALDSLIDLLHGG